MADVRCPRCHQRRGRRCSRSGGLERALSFLYVYPFRCQVCGWRFRALQWGRRYTRMDRRDYERVAVHLLATLTSREGEAPAQVTDLSLTGCGVRVDLHPVAGDQVTLRIQLAPDTPPVEITAVVHSVHTGALGLEFTQMGAAERQRLHDFLTGPVVTPAAPGSSSRPLVVWERPTPSSIAVWLVTLVIVLGAFLVMQLLPSVSVCVWGQTC